MLTNLAIRNFILIQRLDLDLEQGFSVITGGTGAGKSILLDAILFTFGQKIKRDIVKAGESGASVSLVFSPTRAVINFLKENEIDLDGEDLIVKRTLSDSGRSKHFINDQIVSKKIADELFDYLMEIHGQHSHTDLLNVAEHIKILDEYAASYELLEKCGEAYKNWNRITNQLDELKQNKESIEEEIDYLRSCSFELNQANIKVGEADILTEQRIELIQRDRKLEMVYGFIQMLEGSAIDQVVGNIQKQVSRSTNPDEFSTVEEQLETAYNSFEEAKNQLEIIRDKYESLPSSLEEVDDRLHAIKDLARKHNCQADDLPELLTSFESRLAELEGLIVNSDQLEKDLLIAKDEYHKIASELSATRKKFAAKLEDIVHQELAQVQMNKARFVIDIETDQNCFSQSGYDKLRFKASTNPGTEAAPIDKIASGGELSRFMLALKSALFAKEQDKTLIFDEIDVGISGSVAESIGKRLQSLSKKAQLFVITHQPQVAGKADNHILVKKTQHDEHTEVEVKAINGKEKSAEIARMISGHEITETGIRAAEELIG